MRTSSAPVSVSSEGRAKVPTVGRASVTYHGMLDDSATLAVRTPTPDRTSTRTAGPREGRATVGRASVADSRTQEDTAPSGRSSRTSGLATGRAAVGRASAADSWTRDETAPLYALVPTPGRTRSSVDRQIRGETRDPVVKYIAEQLPRALRLSIAVYLVVAVVSWYAGREAGYFWHGFITDQVQAAGLALGVFGSALGLLSVRAIVIDRS